jgi:hypothetical protein
MEHFRADDAMKAYTYNLSLDALNNIAACKTTINTSTANDKPKDLREVLLYIWCMECRNMYQKCMNISTPYPINAIVLRLRLLLSIEQRWACWMNPEACAITCQCDVLREKPDCKACSYKC